MKKRRPPSKPVEQSVLIASRRRCCLCVFLEDRDRVCRGQIAHLNRDPSDSRFDNLVFLCLEHHDEYDSKTSQSKALSVEEVREYRDQLYARNPHSKQIIQVVNRAPDIEVTADNETPNDYEIARNLDPTRLEFINRPWRFPLWQVANEPEFFAYKASNRADGVCLIERIDLPDDRIVIACIQTAGNPGNSITNCVEDICFQVCERFELPAEKLVWLEHYSDGRRDEWRLVSFDRKPPEGPFEGPRWETMTPAMWQDLRLRPRKRLRLKPLGLGFESTLIKLFDWPTENLI